MVLKCFYFIVPVMKFYYFYFHSMYFTIFFNTNISLVAQKMQLFGAKQKFGS